MWPKQETNNRIYMLGYLHNDPTVLDPGSIMYKYCKCGQNKTKLIYNSMCGFSFSPPDP